MSILGALFFVIIPTILLLTITSLGEVGGVQRLSETLEILPQQAQAQIQGSTPTARTTYALAVFLFAPVAVVVPLTISTAIGAATIVGERERGTGEFLAHSPATTREIYVGKLIASLVPGYVTTLVGFTAYSLIVNLIVGPEVGGWFFPTRQWWLLMLWVLPAFLLIGLSLVLRLSARVRSTTAAQQASGLITLPLIAISYGQASGSIYGSSTTTLFIGAIAWLIGIMSTIRGMSAVKRQRLLGVADGV
jgi:ABC-type Na+ efflux pump permease subunit